MNEATKSSLINDVMTPGELLNHWQGHRSLTRKVIEAFPEKEFFTHSIGGMRTFAEMAMELIDIAGPGIVEIATQKPFEYEANPEPHHQKAAILAKWDETTDTINTYWSQIGKERFHDKIKAFGRYEGTMLSTILYYIDSKQPPTE